MPPNEVEKFFNSLPSEDKKEAEIFQQPNANTPVTEKKEEEDTEGRKNRRHRRLEEALQRERDSNIALNERIKVLAEQENYKRESREGDVDPRLVRVFGDNDVGKEIARNFSEILSETAEQARSRAIEEIEGRRISEQQEQKEYESLIDSRLESLEDTHNIDLTSDAPKARKARREFLEMVEKLSPKDEEGTITGYADFDATFDQYLKSQDKPDASRQKELASISMQRSGSGSSNTSKITPGFRGWQKDYNID